MGVSVVEVVGDGEHFYGGGGEGDGVVAQRHGGEGFLEGKGKFSYLLTWFFF